MEINKIYNMDCLEGLRMLPDESINVCVTSPPYFCLRDYGVEGQIGLEETPEEYIDRLVQVFREVRRVLKPDGTLWVNIADSYCATATGSCDNSSSKLGGGKSTQAEAQKRPSKKPVGDIKIKDLIGIPWMLAFALRADGWYLRADIIWNKPNAMPESVKDRPTKAHEYIFLLSKSKKYYYDAEAVKEPAVGFYNAPPAGSLGSLQPNARRRGNSKTFRGGSAYTHDQSKNNSFSVERESSGLVPNESGKRNKRSVWTVATRPFKGAHFATFPEQLVEPCILAGCPAGGLALDPFMGSGTTAVVAIRNERNFIGFELSPQYCELAAERVTAAQNEPKQLKIEL